MPLRILLITPRFYGVEKEIRRVLEEMKYEVTWIENKELHLDYHGTQAKFRVLRRIYFFFFSPQVSYLKRELKRLDNIRFDILFSINASVVCPFLFKKLERNNPDLFTVLYLWDSSSMYSWQTELGYFDRVITFDQSDSQKFNIEYKPNFHIRKFHKLPSHLKHDLFFAGKFSYSRFVILDQLSKLFEESNITFNLKLWPYSKIFLHNILIYRMLRRFRFACNWIKVYLFNYEAVEGILQREFIKKERLDYNLILEEMLCSNVILDLPFEKQSGYSHRLIEALATGKKLITSNLHICNEPFYNPEQVHIINIQDPQVDCDWIRRRAVFPVSMYFSELELSAWLKSILNA